MRFFRLQSPEYGSDRQNLEINGSLEYVYKFPTVTCSTCNSTFGGSRVLADSAPPEIHDDRRFRSRWPITNDEHAAMQKEIAGYLNKEYVSFETFRPGDLFQPAYLDIPVKPEADFLWPNIRSFVISERMKRMVFDDLAGDVDVVPIQWRKIGKQSPESIEPYYQVLVRAVSDYPKGGSPISICPVCKHEAIEDEKRELVMRAEMWRGQAIFFLRTTLYVLVTEALADKIQGAGATNVVFVPF